MIRSNTGRDGNLELLGFGKTFCREISRMEAVLESVRSGTFSFEVDIRRGDDDFGVDKLLVEFGACALLVRCSHESMALGLDPFSNPELVLGRSKQLWHINGMLVALVEGLAC